ncbi:type II secretion system secretin GspD [Oceanospirillum beijerinckii]|uniref:type II secretion system secretin GspD n=1 Tax=Oceanospirillum beijerinckii TaxID=64976 RepID=UPI000A011ACE|nr:type II secretion system secretin GspD [Oceanospirillum beijerinckii]
MEFRLFKRVLAASPKVTLGYPKIIAVCLLSLSLSVQAASPSGSINIKNTEIDAFISMVANITGKSFIVDPRVKGKVTIISQEGMPADSVYELFLSVLNVHGYVAIESGDGAVKIIPSATSKQEGSISRAKKGDNFITEVIVLKNAEVSELVPVLRPLVPQYGHLAGVQSSNALIISDHAGNITRLKTLIRSLDNSQDEQIDVIPLKHAWVGDLAQLLEQLVPEVGKASNRKVGQLSIVADERSNRLIVKGSLKDRAKINELITRLDQPFESKGITQVIPLNYAEATKVAELLSKLIDEPQKSSEKSTTQQSNQFQADEALNALVVRAEPSVMSEVRNLVSQLDVRRAQVLIEAVIVEVTGNNGEELGVQWLLGDFADGPIAGTSFSNVGTSTQNVVSAVASGGTTSIGTIKGALVGGADKIGSLDVGVILQALATTGNSNLLSTPSVMTLDNEEAEFIVGQNVPFITGSSNTTSDTTNPFTTIKREDVGITLRVKPQINDDSSVRLEVYQEVSSLAASDNSLDSADLITNKRSIDTTILVQDGDTIVLGGLIQDDEVESVQKVPLLGDIPLLGALFRSESTNKVKRNLLVFLRPKIINDIAGLKQLTQSKYQGIYSLEGKNGDVSVSADKGKGNIDTLFNGHREGP